MNRIIPALFALFVFPLAWWPLPGSAQIMAYTQQAARPVASPATMGSLKLRDALLQLKKQYGIDIIFEEKLLEGLTVGPDLIGNQQGAEKTLAALLRASGLRYKKVGKNAFVVLIKRENKRAFLETPPANLPVPQLTHPASTEAIAPLTGPSPNWVTTKLIGLSGRVTEANGTGLPGVNVALKGTSTGTITDAEGNFKLSLPDEQANGTLVISSIGYIRQELPIRGRTVLNLTLTVDTKTLNEVVVVGYGTQQRKEITSSQVSVKAADIQNIPNANLGSLLQGRAAGVQVIQNSGAPGAGATIRIRGISSLRAGNDPLYIVDDVPVANALTDINPNDIETIDVLKDAAAVAIYGARASGGVVLITTKRGKGRNKIALTTTYGFQNIAKKLEVLDTPDLLPIMREMYDNTGIKRDAFFTQIDTTINVNWAESILRNNAPIRTIDLSTSGGEGKIKYAASINYFNQDGIVVQSGFARVTGRLNLDVEVTKKLRFGNSLTLTNTRPQNAPANGATSAGVYLNALVKNPLSPVLDPVLGGYNFFEAWPGTTGNPLASLYEVDRDAVNNRAFGNVFAEYAPLPGLTLRTAWGLDYRTGSSNTFSRSTSNNNRNISGSFSNFVDSRWINTNTVTYKRTFGKVHDVTLLGVYEQQEDRNEDYSANGSQFPNDKVKTLNAAALISAASSGVGGSGLESLLGRFTYSYRDKYVLSGNVRRDGSSRFGRNNRYGVFPSVSAAWNASEEAFLKGISQISFLKVRGSAGQVGNQNGLGNYNARGLYVTGDDYAGQPGIRAGALPNPDLIWETTTQYNLGVDLGIFNERVTLSVDAYLKRTNDLLVDQIVPQSAGTGTITVNLGKMENKGLEFNLTTRNLLGTSAGALKWTTNLNLAMNRNKVVILTGDPTDLIQVFAETRVYGVNALESVLSPGQPVGQLYGYITDGIYAHSEDNAAGLRNSSATGPLFVGGDVIFRDLNGDGIINTNDRTTIGRTQPYHTGGINNTLSYKGLSLDVFMNWSYGNQVFNATRQSLTGLETPGRNYLTDVQNRWRKPGDITDQPRAAYGVAGNPNSSPTQTRFLEDGSYLRLSNVTLAYQLPQGLVQRLRLDNVRAYVTGNNLALLTKYRGVDPDVRSFTSEGQYGIDFGAYPRARTITFGLTLGL